MQFTCVLLFLLVVLSACDSSKSATDFNLLGLPGEKIIYVADRTETCTGVVEQQCLLVKEAPEDEWEFWYDGITGFDYVAGKQYVLRIQERELENPPQDASSIEWIYVETLEIR